MIVTQQLGRPAGRRDRIGGRGRQCPPEDWRTGGSGLSGLAGAYNGFGIRRWFERPRAQLDGRSPREVLDIDWDPVDPDAARVRVLAAVLASASAAT